MKKNLLKTLIVLIILPVLVLVGCKNKSLPTLNLSRYLKSEITIKRYGLSEEKSDNLSLLTESKAKEGNLSQYLKFEIKTNPVWTYKMYVEKITFYVYCNESSEYQMTINVKMTDLASEEAILETTTENVETEEIEEQITITPQGKKAIKCSVNINKTIVNAFGSSISIDVYNSPELFSGEGENKSNFMWLIYGLEIHGESRTYSR